MSTDWLGGEMFLCECKDIHGHKQFLVETHRNCAIVAQERFSTLREALAHAQSKVKPAEWRGLPSKQKGRPPRQAIGAWNS